MPDITYPTRVAGVGGVSLKAAGLIAATTAHTAVDIGTGPFSVMATVTACEVASNDELYILAVEANTIAAPTVWANIGVFAAFGATEKLASMGDTPEATTFGWKAAFHNPYDYQVRLKTWVSGTIAGGGGINFKADLFPIDSLSVPG